MGTQNSVRFNTEFGPLSAGVVSGPTQVAVLWHSMFTDSRSWDRVVDDLRVKGTLVLVDGYGFGSSAGLDHQIPRFVEGCGRAAAAVIADSERVGGGTRRLVGKRMGWPRGIAGRRNPA